MRFRLWGTRGSIPSPLRTQDIETKIRAALSAASEAGIDLSDPTAIRAFVASLPYAIRGTAGGDTACLEVRSGSNLFIFDCGSGIRQLGQELMKQEFGRGQGVAHIFMSHTHWDHMMGWPFFVPGFRPGNEFYIYGVHPDLERRFRIQQTAPDMFPASLDDQLAKIQFITIQEGSTVEIGQTRISNMRLNHPGIAYGYRIEDDDGVLVYATDNEYKTLDPAATQGYVEFFRDADALIFDAMYTFRESYLKEDWGHGYAVAGADLATRAGVHRLLLFHHDPTYTDEEIWRLRKEAENYLEQHPDRPPCVVIVAYDGLEMELWREARLETRLERLPEGTAIHFSGRLAAETAPIALDAINETAAQAGDQHKPLVVNLAEVIHVDQDGLKALLSARRRWRPLALSGLSPELRRTFAQTGALGYFATFDTPQSALLALTQGLDVCAGQVLCERYEIGALLSRGPLGDLYRVTDQVTHQQAAIHVLCPSLGPSPTQASMEAARATARLRHPMIAGTFDVGQDGPIRYLALQHTSGRSLRQLLLGKTGDTPSPVPPAQAVRIGSQIAQALEYAHSRDIVHGALKPENVILVEGNSIVSHFGIGQPDIDKPLSELPAHMGPLDYLAPEQLQGHGNSPSSDLYALGTILYEMLTGSPPFAATTSDEDLINLQLRQPPVPPRRRNPNLSRSLEHLVLNLLRKSPHERPPNASVVRQVLTSLTYPPAPRRLLGRDNLCQKLHHHLERVAQGQSGLLIVHGQRGVGKSRLVLSVADQRAASQPLTTLYGELFADEDTSPYKLFVEILQRTLLNLPAHKITQLFDDLGDLSRPMNALIPDLQPALSAFAPSQIECERLEEAICETLRLMTAEGPVVLILDSLQWIDVASLRLLNRLARQRIPHLLIVGLYRTEEVDQDHPLRQTLDALASCVDDQLHVTPLNPIDVHQMTSTLSASRRVPPDFGLWLYSETEGNPLHIEQLVQVYLEGPSETRPLYERIAALTLEDVILWRLERLPNDALIVLRQAAVLGHTFHSDMLCSALDQPEHRVLAHLDSALQASLILGHPAEDRYSFSHPLIREAIYAEMLGGVRKRYHRRAARVLEQRGVPGVMDEKIDILAHHLLRAGEHEQAVAYLARATVRARKLCAYDAALNYVNQALALVERSLQAATREEERTHRQNQRDDLLAARAKLEKTINKASAPALTAAPKRKDDDR
jgi:serine/threonine protein kinase/phosphoribosyl 1,2-cyclic phosphodiesterase/anti-anti-sigma regulatory factor